MYYSGHGLPRNSRKAERWFRLAAEQGDASAQTQLALIYESGVGVPQDYLEAVKWYRLATEQGSPWAQQHHGHMYGDGRGMAQNYVIAHMWFNLAASDFIDRPNQAGNARANFEARNRMAGLMTPEQVVEAQRLAREWRPKTWEELSGKLDTDP